MGSSRAFSGVGHRKESHKWVDEWSCRLADREVLEGVHGDPLRWWLDAMKICRTNAQFITEKTVGDFSPAWFSCL